MKKRFKHRRHLLKTGLLASVSVIWLILRTGRKPSRVTYPCQKAAAANIYVFLAALFLPFLGSGRFSLRSLIHSISTRKARSFLLLTCLLFALGSVAVAGDYGAAIDNRSYVPINLESQRAIASSGSSDLYFVQNASGDEGNMGAATVTLLQMMQDNGLYFYKTTGHPGGLIAENDVVLIKVNCQWPYRGGTNTDLVKSIISRILDHPKGFVGEVVIADNGQGVGSLSWPQSNAFDHSQSMIEVADSFSSHKVSTYRWDRIIVNRVNEYSLNDFRDGYVVNSTENPITHHQVSYPKFQTAFGSYISFKHGIWDSTTETYNSEKLKIINMPVLKSHGNYGVTASVKHYMGVVSQGLTQAHGAIQYGAMGTEMAETRFPTLNILDAIWINANPRSSGSCGPHTPYADASYTNIIGASQDPVALDYWSSKHILVPAAIHLNYTSYFSLNPDYEPITPGMRESFHNYLERSMNELKRADYQATMNETEMTTHVSTVLPVSLYWSPCDIDQNLKVDMKDVGISARAFNTTPGEPDRNPSADITGSEDLVSDGKVNLKDVTLTSDNFGKRFSY